MRIVFAGTPEVAVPTLQALVSAGHDVVQVITREDALVGRKRTLTPSPVAVAAAALDLPVLKTNQLTPEQGADLSNLAPDIGVIVAFGAVLKKQILEIPTHGWLNIHFSLLPRWRGAAPVQHALIAGDSRTGMSIFRLDEGLDTGDVLTTLEIPLNTLESGGIVLSRLAEAAPNLLLAGLEKIASGNASFSAQSGAPTLAPKITRLDARLDFTQPLERVLGRWAGVTPEPGAYAYVGSDTLKILSIAQAARTDATVTLTPGEAFLANGHVLIGTGSEPAELITVQPAGKAPMSAADWLRGRGGKAMLS